MTGSTPQQQFKSALLAGQEWWHDMGVETPPAPPSAKRKPKPQANVKPAQSARTPEHAAVPKPDFAERIVLAATLAKAAPTLDALKQVIAEFDAGALSDHARNSVFARGNPKADIMAIGEAPGRHEDETGTPFVGPAGQLLDKMFAAIGRSEDNIYITNVCNWRPPVNRNPTEEELALCAPFIARHIELAAPKLVIIVGGISLQALTGKTGIMKTRGQWQELDISGTKIPAMPLYHPAFLLRRPELKKQAWLDLLAIKARISAL